MGYLFRGPKMKRRELFKTLLIKISVLTSFIVSSCKLSRKKYDSRTKSDNDKLLNLKDDSKSHKKKSDGKKKNEIKDQVSAVDEEKIQSIGDTNSCYGQSLLKVDEIEDVNEGLEIRYKLYGDTKRSLLAFDIPKYQYDSHGKLDSFYIVRPPDVPIFFKSFESFDITNSRFAVQVVQDLRLFPRERLFIVLQLGQRFYKAEIVVHFESGFGTNNIQRRFCDSFNQSIDKNLGFFDLIPKVEGDNVFAGKDSLFDVANVKFVTSSDFNYIVTNLMGEKIDIEKHSDNIGEIIKNGDWIICYKLIGNCYARRFIQFS
jgi:hypothetical protein